MNKSNTIKELSSALAKAQAEVKNPHFDAMNPHFKSKFASLGAVREVVIPAFTKHGLSISQWPVSNDGHAGCVTHLAHSSGEWIEETFLIPVDKHNAHGYASAVTYSKRIAMQSVAGVVGDEDDDANAAVGDNVAGDRSEPKSYNAKKDAFERMNADEQAFLRGISLDVIAMLQEGRDDEAYGFLRNKNLDSEEQVAIQHLFDSKQRSALAKAGESWKALHNASAREQHRNNRPEGQKAAA